MLSLSTHGPADALAHFSSARIGLLYKLIRRLIVPGTRLTVAAVCASLLAACSGGGGSPAATSGGGSAPASSSRANVTFQMQWAASSASASAVQAATLRRSPKYLAPTALSVSIEVLGTSTTTTTTPDIEYMNSPQSTLTFAAPTGLDTFEIETYDETNGKGNVLSSAFVTQTVSSGSANVVSAILNGVIKSLALSVSPLQPAAGTASTMTVSATGYDADGNVIVGPGAYAAPIALSIVDPANSGALSLSTAVLQQPGATSTLSYNGKILLSASVSASLVGVTPSMVTIAPTPTVTTYPLPQAGSGPLSLTVDSANNLWFVENGANKIGELPYGTTTFTEHPVPTLSAGLNGIAVGLDGRIWFTEESQNKIGAMTTAGGFSEFPTSPSNAGPTGITERGDGTMWYAGEIGDDVGYRSESVNYGGSVSVPTANAEPFGVAVGPNGLYFTEGEAGKIGVLFVGASSPAEHAITLPAGDNAPPGPQGIVEGPDANMWFTDYNTSAIGRFSTSNSSIVEYPTPTPNAAPEYITVDPDGAMWFTEPAANKIGRITTDGTITEYSVAPSCLTPVGIAVRSNGVVWVTCYDSGALARLVY